jgi:hypothetical protein
LSSLLYQIRLRGTRLLCGDDYECLKRVVNSPIRVRHEPIALDQIRHRFFVTCKLSRRRGWMFMVAMSRIVAPLVTKVWIDARTLPTGQLQHSHDSVTATGPVYEPRIVPTDLVQQLISPVCLLLRLDERPSLASWPSPLRFTYSARSRLTRAASSYIRCPSE